MTGIFSGLDRDQPILFGLAGRIADQFGMQRLLVRVAFAVSCLAAGAGVVIYVVGHLLTVGREAPEPRPHRIRSDVALLLLVAAVISAVTALVAGLPGLLLWLVSMGVFGLAMGAVPREGSPESAGDVVFGSGPIRVVVGIGLVIAAVATALAATQDLAELWRSLTAMVVVLIGLALVLAPWLSQVRSTAEHERLERIRAEERADIAAHLHDSVLQTLTLIQNRAADPNVTASLARRQERELRRWLYPAPGGADAPSDAPTTLSGAIAQVCADVEDHYLVAIESVVVGDAEMDIALVASVAAMREALVNAAKFSRRTQLSVFVEVSEAEATVFVRDRGVGFDLSAVPADRRGVTDSIIGRVERAGGEVRIRTAPGEGTEVAVRMPLAGPPPQVSVPPPAGSSPVTSAPAASAVAGLAMPDPPTTGASTGAMPDPSTSGTQAR